jgi:Tol biopolymer transport system component
VVAADSSSLQPQPIGDPAMGGATMDWHDSALMLFKDSRMFLVHVPETHALPWLPSPFAIYGARFSPDGHLIAYASTQSGATDVWVRPFPGDGAPVRVSIDGGHEPVWSHDGADLYFTRGPKLLMAHMTAALPEPRFDPPRVIVDGGLAYDTSDMVLRFYDVAPDGRILMVEPAETRSASVVVAPHWDEALKALGE